MKATGIVRRIDDLGRVVIPKEIRRTQMIRVGDPLEIFVSDEGEVIFKKYSHLNELSLLAQKCAEVLAKITGLQTVVVDRDRIVAASPMRLIGQEVTESYSLVVNARIAFVANSAPAVRLVADREDYAYAIMPVLCQGDLIGSVAYIAPREQARAANADMRSLQMGAALIARQLEE